MAHLVRWFMIHYLLKMVICQFAILNYQRVNKIIIPFIFHWLIHPVIFHYYPLAMTFFSTALLDVVALAALRHGEPASTSVCHVPWWSSTRCKTNCDSKKQTGGLRCFHQQTRQFNQEHVGLTSWQSKNKWLLFARSWSTWTTNQVSRQFQSRSFFESFFELTYQAGQRVATRFSDMILFKRKGFSLPLPANLQNKNSLLAIGGCPTLQ